MFASLNTKQNLQLTFDKFNSNYSNLKILQNIPTTKLPFSINSSYNNSNLKILNFKNDTIINKDNYSNLQILRNIPSTNSPFGKRLIKYKENYNNEKLGLNSSRCTLEKTKNIMALQRDNASSTVLSHQLDISSTTCHNLKSKSKSGRILRKYSLEEKNQAISFYRQSNFKLKEVAQKLGIPSATVKNWVYNKVLNEKQKKDSVEQKTKNYKRKHTIE